MNLLKHIFGTITIVLLLVSCKNDQNTKISDGKLRIVATTGMVADLVKNIGGEYTEVEALMGPGVDPHLYKATQGDLSRLQKADLIFYNGLHLEGKMGEVFEKLGNVKKVIPIAEAIPKERLLSDPNYQDALDPHIWFDVKLWILTIDKVLEELVLADNERKEMYTANANNFKSALVELDEFVREEILSIPEKKRILITAHDAFNYFGRAYEIQVRGLQGISTLSEFGLRDRVELVNYIVENEIRSVFVETSVSEKNINSIVEGCKQKGHNIEIGGHLYSDAMGPEGTIEGTYIGMIRANVQTIVEGLKDQESL